jgi:hypothetical protein
VYVSDFRACFLLGARRILASNAQFLPSDCDRNCHRRVRALAPVQSYCATPDSALRRSILRGYGGLHTKKTGPEGDENSASNKPRAEQRSFGIWSAGQMEKAAVQDRTRDTHISQFRQK